MWCTRCRRIDAAADDNVAQGVDGQVKVDEEEAEEEDEKSQDRGEAGTDGERHGNHEDKRNNEQAGWLEPAHFEVVVVVFVLGSVWVQERWRATLKRQKPADKGSPQMWLRRKERVVSDNSCSASSLSLV